MINETARIYADTTIGPDCVIEEFAIIGIRHRGAKAGELKTTIGQKAVIRSHSVIYAGNRIGNDFQTGNKVNIREMNRIGDHVSVGTLTVIEHHTTIGKNVRIHSQAFIPEYTVIEDGCWIGPNVVITNAKYPNSPNAKNELRGCRIQQNAIIGANSTLLPGVIVGRGAIVGAAAVVTKNIPEGMVVAGNPAVIINEASRLPYDIRHMTA